MGMNPEHVGTLEFSFPRGTTNVTRLTKLRAIIERLERDPSIQDAAVVNDLPLRGNGGIALSITVDGVPKPKSMDEMAFSRYLRASSGYFKTLGIPILRGQTFAATTDSLSPPTAVISETMAKQWWPNGDALGKTFHFGGGGLHPTFTVIGIAADVRESGLERKLQPQMYLPIERETPDNAAIVARGTLPPATLLARLNEAVRAVDPSQAVYNVRMMDAVVAKSMTPRRTNTTLIVIFGGVALLLSAFGVYAVVSYSVTRRAREFGIRAALGATGRNIVALVGRELIGVLVVGLAIGLAGAWALSRLMAALLFQVDAHDLPTFLAAPVALILPAVIAMLVPARRAMKVSPVEVMRAE
jgi:predicted permease